MGISWQVPVPVKVCAIAGSTSMWMLSKLIYSTFDHYTDNKCVLQIGNSQTDRLTNWQSLQHKTG